jgi:hypothetical protein
VPLWRERGRWQAPLRPGRDRAGRFRLSGIPAAGKGRARSVPAGRAARRLSWFATWRLSAHLSARALVIRQRRPPGRRARRTCRPSDAFP